MEAPLFLAGCGVALGLSVIVGAATESLLHGAAAFALGWFGFALYVMRRLSHPSWCALRADPACRKTWAGPFAGISR